MRILVASPSLGIGGLERISVDLANALAARGAGVAFAAPPGALAVELDNAIERVPLRAGGRAPGAAAESAVRIARAARSAKADVVHAHNVRIAGVAGVGLRGLPPRRRPPLVATFHGVRAQEDRAAALTLRLASAVVCVSDALAGRLRARGGPPVSVIPNAVAPVPPLDGEARARLDAELGLGEGPVVAWVGRLTAVKAPGRFLEAARLVAAEVPGTTFLVAGDGPLREALERDASGLDVRFTGWRADARALVARSDVLVVSSDSEGLSVVALEALSAGVPVVATPVSGMAELLGGGGGVVAERADAAQLAAGVVSLLRDPEARARHGEAGRAVVARRYGLDAMVDAYVALFERLRR